MLRLKREEQSKLMRLESMETAAHKFGLFKTGNGIKGIQEGLVVLDEQEKGQRGGKIIEVLKLVDRTEIELAGEYEDQKPEYKRKAVVGNGILIGLLGAMAGDMALIFLKPNIMENLPDWLGQNLQKTIVGVAACIAIYPVRCLYRDYKIDKLKDDIGALLGEIKADLKALAGSEPKPAPRPNVEPDEDPSGWF